MLHTLRYVTTFTVCNIRLTLEYAMLHMFCNVAYITYNTLYVTFVMYVTYVHIYITYVAWRAYYVM